MGECCQAHAESTSSASKHALFFCAPCQRARFCPAAATFRRAIVALLKAVGALLPLVRAVPAEAFCAWALLALCGQEQPASPPRDCLANLVHFTGNCAAKACAACNLLCFGSA